ncbi:MAG: TlpA family protein disulfide reductase [Microthrixaceae bacterium]
MTDTKRGASPYDDISKHNSEGNPKMGLIIGGAVVAVIVVIAAIVFLWPSGGDGENAEAGTGADAASNAVQENATVTISGEDLPALPSDSSGVADAATDPAVGLAAPVLTGESFDGSEISIGPDDGRPKIVVFVAHWCPHCQNEVPLIQDWIDSGGLPEGVDVYAVATGQDPSQVNYPPSRWLANEGWTPKVLLDDTSQSAAASWGLTGYPYFVMLDADGNVWQRGSGEIPEADLDRMAKQLAAGEAATSAGGGDPDLQTPVTIEGSN